MRIKKSFAISSIGLAALAAVVCGLLVSRSNRGVTPEDFERLEPGMTRAEVDRLLHGPPRNDLRYSSIVWLPQANGKRISHAIEPIGPAFELFSHEDKPKNQPRRARPTSARDFFPQEPPNDGHQALWITRTGLIAVDFGPDGRLRRKYSSTVHEPVGPSLMGWLKTRPGMIRRARGF